MLATPHTSRSEVLPLPMEKQEIALAPTIVMPAAHASSGLAEQGGEEGPAMKAYRTESPYYFSSKKLLPAGSLVFFSGKIKRYVHPTDGILFDLHPRLQSLSEEESLGLESHWKKELSRYE